MSDESNEKCAKGRPHIEEWKKRAVRKRCHFGCVRCGIPLYEYHHMDQYARVREHDPDRITLLCPNHHSECTKDLFPLELIEQANAKPCNQNAPLTRERELYFTGNNVRILVGNNIVRYNDLVEEQDYGAFSLGQGYASASLRIEDSHLLVSLHVSNQYGPIVRIRNNQLVHTTATWDVEMVKGELTMRSGVGEIFFKMKWKPPGELEIISAELPTPFGVYRITPGGVTTPNGSTFDNCSMTVTDVGFVA